MGDFPKRKRIRLKDYDYSKNGYYFITICAHNRKILFGDVGYGVPDVPQIELSQYGKVVQKYIHSINNTKEIIVKNYLVCYFKN